MIGILQLSDIHFGAGPNPVLSRIAQIKGAVQAEADTSELLLIISGDVANWGKSSEYSTAINFISDLENQLKTIKGIRFLGAAVIPGNHDLDFDAETTVRPLLLANIAELIDKVDDDLVTQLVGVQANFFEFEELIGRRPHPGKDRLLWDRVFISDAGKILIRCFNTAWVSRKKEIPGQIFFPAKSLPESQETDQVLVISTFHHPYGWMNPDNAREFRRVIETSSDIVLTGHEHDGDAYTKITAAGETINYVEGAPLQAEDVETGFNLVKVDLKEKTYRVRQFKWNRDMYEVEAESSRTFTRNQSLLEHQFINNSAFKDYLNDMGAPFDHPIRTKLILSDLYVYPDLKVESLAKGHTKDKDIIVPSDKVLDYIANKSLVSIAGPPTSGKTALAKTLYMDLQQRRNLVPILLQSDDIRGISEPQVQSALERAFDKQYDKKTLNRFNQLDPEAKVLIFDDWHKLKSSPKGRRLVLDAIQRRFNHVVLLTDDASMFTQLTDAMAAGEVLNVEYCQIKPFGYQMRGELVTKWESLGRELELEEMELTRQISESENLLDTLVGKGIVPSFPFFIFFALQSGNADQTAMYGSYGHIYQALLTQRMARVNPKNLGLKFAFLSLLAFEMYKKGIRSISRAQVEAAHRTYEKEYAMSVDFGQLMEELVAGQVLIVHNDSVEFKYRYGYFYFVAQYFHDGISNVKEAAFLRENLTIIADNAYTDDNAHVLVFYLYMSKDRTLMEYILKNAQALFASEGPSDMDKDVSFATPLYSAQPRLEAPSDSTRENRRQHRMQRDAAAEEEEDEQDNPDQDESENREIDFGIQSISIMGQVLRNFATELKGDLKFNLTQESYRLGLRMMHHFLKFVENNADAFRRDMFKYFKLLQPFSRKTDEEVNVAVDKALVAFVELILFGSIKRICEAVGVQELRDTYETLRASEGESHIPTRIIDLAIKLEHFAYIPEEDVQDLKRRLQGNPAVYTTVRMLVAEFLHLFPVENRIRQRTEKLLDFQPGSPLISSGKRVKRLTTKSGKAKEH